MPRTSLAAATATHAALCLTGTCVALCTTATCLALPSLLRCRCCPAAGQVVHALQLYKEAGLPTRFFTGVPVFQAEGLTVTTQEMVRPRDNNPPEHHQSHCCPQRHTHYVLPSSAFRVRASVCALPARSNTCRCS